MLLTSDSPLPLTASQISLLRKRLLEERDRIQGASVTLAVRRPDAAEPVAIELRRSTGNHAIDVRTLDLADLRSVKSFTDAWEGPLHILVNNAGIMAVPELEKTLRESSCSSAPTSLDTSR